MSKQELEMIQNERERERVRAGKIKKDVDARLNLHSMKNLGYAPTITLPRAEYNLLITYHSEYVDKVTPMRSLDAEADGSRTETEGTNYAGPEDEGTNN